MALTLAATSNPGTASWYPGVAVAGRVTFDIADGSEKTVTIPAGLEGASAFVDYVSNPNDFGLVGGLMWSSISGTTLTINIDGTTSDDGCVVSYVIIGPA